MTAFPYPGYRTVVGAVAVPPAFLRQVEPTGERKWAYFSKHGLVVRAGGPVTISVPVGWRQRVGIVWGNGGLGIFDTVRIAGCGSDRSTGNAYAGGFFLRRAADCVPLVVRAGRRSRTVWFGVGRRCT